MLRRNLVANYLGQAWVALMGLAFIPLYIKYLGIEAYGMIGLFGLLTAWSSLLDIGMTPTLSREMARFTGGCHTAESIRDLLRSIEIIMLSVAVALMVALLLVARWIATYWLNTEQLPVGVISEGLVIMGMVTSLRLVEAVYRSGVVGLQRQVLLNLITGGMATLRAVGAVVLLAWVSPTLQAFFLWQGLVSVLTLVMLARTTYSVLPKTQRAARFSLTALRSVWHFAGNLLLITFLSLLLGQTDKILLSKLLSLTEFGYYTLAATISGALYFLIQPITQAWFPRISELLAGDDQNRLANAYHQGAQLVTVILGSAALVLMVAGEACLVLWTQDAVLAHRVAPILSLLALGNLLNGLVWIPYQMQLAYGWTTLAVRGSIVAVTFIVPAILWVTPRYGAEGAAWVWVTLNASYLLIGIHFMHRKILQEEKWRWYVDDVLRPLVPALLIALMFQIILDKNMNQISQLIIVILFSISTLLIAFIFARKVRQSTFGALLDFYRKRVPH